MKYLWILLFVSCLALSEALITGAVASGGGGNDVAYWATPAGERFAPIGMSDDGQVMLVKDLNRDGGARVTPQGVTFLTGPTSPTELRSISPNGKYASGYSGSMGVLWDLSSMQRTLFSDWQYVDAMSVDNNGTIGGNYIDGSSEHGNQAFRKTLNGPYEQLMPGYAHSSVMATSASGSVLSLLAYQVSGGPTRAFYFTGTGPAVELPSAAGETYTIPWGVSDTDGKLRVVGGSGTLSVRRPFAWALGDPAKTTMPPLGSRTKGDAACVAAGPWGIIYGGYAQSNSSDRKAVLWLPDGNGGLVARDAEQLVRALFPELGPLKLTEVVALSQYSLLTEAVDSFSSPTVCRGIVLNLWYSTPLGSIKAQPVSSPVSVTTAPVIASYPDAGVFYIENHTCPR